ncbi:MAG: nucleotidyl transferase AbiEii/AbiGii toxin family protein [Chloracidobacterium sp.]|nr:nucleotidyl transferase AbiEii/AbiGii toxin family protein [Chloracidobacterium sp.]
MISLFEEAARLQELLLDEALDFFFVGGIPLQKWGQPRLTTDIDLTVFTELVDEDERIKWFLSRFKPLIGTAESTLQFARQRRVLLIQTESKTEIDVMLGGLADISEELRRSSYQQFTPSTSLKICSADTLIALKTVAGRGQDFVDIETVLIKQDFLDWGYIDGYLDQVMEYEDISVKRERLGEIRESLKK